MTYLILHLGPLTTLLQGLQEGLQLCSPFYFVVRTTNSPAGEILPCHFKAWRQNTTIRGDGMDTVLAVLADRRESCGNIRFL